MNGVATGMAGGAATGVAEPSSTPVAFFCPMSEASPETFSLEEVFEAYHSCRRHKRSKASALAFEVDLESNLIELWRELNSGGWKPGPSAVFIVEKPVKREIFAAGFRDRVVHHVLIHRLNPYFEKTFIYDSYSCRVGKGTHFGIERVKRFVRRCSDNYTHDAWVLKLDIRGFFMNISRPLLVELLGDFLARRYPHPDRGALLALCRNLVLNDPLVGCVTKSPPELWDGLPAEKSLFGVPADRGLPIGNLTSQVFANFYLDGLDHFCKHELGLRYYGRYVDDLVIVHEDRDRLAALVPRIRDWLARERLLDLHPRKIRLQHYAKGVPFLGAYILPGRVYPGHRLRRNFRDVIDRHDAVVDDHAHDGDEIRSFRSSINSYLGILKHANSWRFRVGLLRARLSPWWKCRFVLPEGAEKVLKRPEGYHGNVRKRVKIRRLAERPVEVSSEESESTDNR
ncbi:MAG: reverse transcriptase/maturase family protein [Spirochaetes bacterium]|nr:reverse transcriptase/maturase family protein [Spirochaetota bacterium]